MNQLKISGFIHREPKIEFKKTGLAVCNFTLTLKDRHTGKYNFFDVACFRDVAEEVGDMESGTLVMVEGSLVQDRWQYNGKNYSKIKILAWKVKIMHNEPREKKEDYGESDSYEEESGEGFV
jgi:single-stranded DNA-binding protein